MLYLFNFYFLAAVTCAAQLIGCSSQELMLSLSTNNDAAKKLTLQQVC